MIPNRDPQDLTAFPRVEENITASPHRRVLIKGGVVALPTPVVPLVADEWIVASGQPPIGFDQREQRRKLRRKSSDRPLVPTAGEIAKLTRWGRIAYAARCARRILPLIDGGSAPLDPLVRAAFIDLVEAAEQSAAHAELDKHRIAVAMRTLKNFSDDSLPFGHQLLSVTFAAAHAEGCRAAEVAVTVLQQLASVETLSFALMPRRDFHRLQRLTRKNKWTDDTGIAPTAFGPMWLRAPDWWRELESPK
ncbi:MAG TPA: hypothetical protein VN641_12760 [Urbifossiella sp.]|nr:hypothetical protein [Urbifossiella sp.]